MSILAPSISEEHPGFRPDTTVEWNVSDKYVMEITDAYEMFTHSSEMFF